MKYDYTAGNLSRNIFLLAVPMSLEMFFLATYSVVDIFFISRLGEQAIAAVGLASAILMVPISFSLGLGNAYLMVISRRIGEKKLQSACVVLGQVLWLSTLLGLVTGLFGYWIAAPCLRWVGASPEVVLLGENYLAQRQLWILIANLLFSFNSCLRGAGNARTALSILALSNLSNIILDPILIFGWRMIPAYGVDGAAYATIISQGFGLVAQILILLHGTDRLRFSRQILRFHRETAQQILRLAAITIPHAFLRLSSALLLNSIITIYGTVVVAAFAIVSRLQLMVILPALGIGNAIATLVGQNLGAGFSERAKKTSKLGMFYTGIYMTGMATALWYYAPDILMWMRPTPETLIEEVWCLRFIAVSYPLFGMSIILNSTFRGAGDPRTPLALDFISRWGIRIFGGYFLSRYTELAVTGIWLAIILAEFFHAYCGYCIWRKGRWQQIKL